MGTKPCSGCNIDNREEVDYELDHNSSSFLETKEDQSYQNNLVIEKSNVKIQKNFRNKVVNKKEKYKHVLNQIIIIQTYFRKYLLKKDLENKKSGNRSKTIRDLISCGRAYYAIL